MKLLHNSLLSTALVLRQFCLLHAVDEVKYKNFKRKVETDALELAREVEELFKNRCNTTILKQCNKGNYHGCISEFPGQQCFGDEVLGLSVCGGGTNNCGALWDYNVSNIEVPSELGGFDSTDERVVEAVCSTRELDKWLVKKSAEDFGYWSSQGLPSPAMFFGSTSGAFRHYPARQIEICNEFDPRVRPWYIAGSSGPKNVILILDTSESTEGRRLKIMKKAATQVIESLTVGDRVAIVQLASEGDLFGEQDKYLYKANATNKKILTDAIDGFSANGGSLLNNILDAFNHTFAVLDNSFQQDKYVRGNTAVLFFTDEGEFPDSSTVKESVLDFINDGLSSLQMKLSNRRIFLFTYSISTNDSVKDNAFPKQIACSSSGIWDYTVDEQGMRKSLTSYFLLFALGLDTERNKNFTTWVEPYEYYTGGVLGTTVSAPVYDRTKDPPLLMGVVGIDFPVLAVDRALDLPDGRKESIDRIVEASVARPVNISLTPCQLEAIRLRGNAEVTARCKLNCTNEELRIFEEKPCLTENDYPDGFSLWKNQAYKDLPYTFRKCCKVGEDGPSDVCPVLVDPTVTKTAAIIGGAVAGGFVVLIVVVLLYQYHHRAPSGKIPAENRDEPDDISIVVGDSVVVMESPPRPSAPYNPQYRPESGSSNKAE